MRSGALTARYGKGINTTVDEPVVVVGADGQPIAIGNGSGMEMLGAVAFHENQRAEVRLSKMASLSGTGGGKPGQGYPAIMIYPVAMRGRAEGAELEMGEDGEPAFSRRTGTGGSSKPMVCVTGEVTHTLTSEGADASEDGTGRGTPIVVFDWQTAGSERTRPNISSERTSAIQTTNRDAVMTGVGVRRLTPLECERLQGFPDRHTAGHSDAQRYRQLGNAVAVPVVEWIARRLVNVDQKDAA